MYAKLLNGVLEYAPVNYTLSDGRAIVNFNKNEVLMKKYGFKLVVDEKPIYNQDTEYLVITGYNEQETTVTVLYTIKQMELVDQEATIEFKIEQLKKTDSDHELALAELTEIILGGGVK